MKVEVTERTFKFTVRDREVLLLESEAREIWAGLNEHFGPKATMPTEWTKYPFRHPIDGGTVTYPPYWHPDSPLKVTCESG